MIRERGHRPKGAIAPTVPSGPSGVQRSTSWIPYFDARADAAAAAVAAAEGGRRSDEQQLIPPERARLLLGELGAKVPLPPAGRHDRGVAHRVNAEGHAADVEGRRWTCWCVGRIHEYDVVAGQS